MSREEFEGLRRGDYIVFKGVKHRVMSKSEYEDRSYTYCEGLSVVILKKNGILILFVCKNDDNRDGFVEVKEGRPISLLCLSMLKRQDRRHGLTSLKY